MSQYEQIKKLSESHSNSLDLSYSTLTLSLRSQIPAWVEQQDWYSVLNSDPREPGQETVCENRARILFEQTLQELLREGSDNPLLKLLETSLKTEYENDPVRFVRDIATGLRREQELLADMAFRNCASPSGAVSLSEKELISKADECNKFAEHFVQVLKNADVIFTYWRDDIMSKSTEQRDLFKNGKLVGNPYTTLVQQKEKLHKLETRIISLLDVVLRALKVHISSVWKTHQLHTLLNRQPEKSVNPQYVEEVCEKVCSCLDLMIQAATCTLMENIDCVQVPSASQAGSLPVPQPSLKSQMETRLKQLLEAHLGSLLVVFLHPPMTMMMGKDKGGKDSEHNNSKKFTTSVGIIGGKGFQDHVTFKYVDIYLCHNQDLADAQVQNREVVKKFKIHTDKNADKKRGCEEDAQGPPHRHLMKVYESVHVEGYNRNDTKQVYKQIYHAVYTVQFHFTLLQLDIQKETISMPILVRTGAVQASEHIGVMQCHCFAARNVLDSRATVPSEMRVDDLIQMMDERVRGIGGRGLRDYERELLREKLNSLQSKSGKSKPAKDSIKLESFIKENLVLPSSNGAGTGDEMKFSLWRWFHSICNLLEKSLRDPWKDGVIYGFAHRRHCEEVLITAADGTFLLRFSESTVEGNHEASEGGLGPVGMLGGEVKFAPPIPASKIKSDGLGPSVRAIQVNCQGLYQILGTEHLIDFLDRYHTPQQEEQTRSRYLGFQEQKMIVGGMSKLTINSPAQSFGPASPPIPPSPAVSDAPSETKRRKMARRRSSEQDMPISQPLSPDSASMDSQFYPVATVVTGNLPLHVQSMVDADSTRVSKAEVTELQAVPLSGAGPLTTAGGSTIVSTTPVTSIFSDQNGMQFTVSDGQLTVNGGQLFFDSSEGVQLGVIGQDVCFGDGQNPALSGITDEDIANLLAEQMQNGGVLMDDVSQAMESEIK